jgi:SAM-dependent methyltransferase
MREYIHGKIDANEVARLEFQAPFVASFALRNLRIRPGERVLDLGCGVGAMTAQMASLYPGIALFAVDIDLEPLRVALANHPVAGFVRADGAHLPFGDHAFNCVHSSWLLEHVASPVTVLREVRRVLRPGGQCQFLEVDNSSWRTEPEYPEVLEVISALNQAQCDRGGDPYIGRRLGALLREAGFSRLDASPVHLRGDASNPVAFRMTHILADIIDSANQALGPTMAPAIRAAAAKLRAMIVDQDAIQFCPVLGHAIR